MLTEKENTHNISKFKITKGELELALLKNNTWEMAQDVKDTSNIVEIKTFTFGERYGIIKPDKDDKSYVNINGNAWYLSTIEETTMPILESTTAKYYENSRTYPSYMELREAVYYPISFSWN